MTRLQNLLGVLYETNDDKARLTQIVLENNVCIVKEHYKRGDDILKIVKREIGKEETLEFENLDLTAFPNLESIEIKGVSLTKPLKKLNCSNLAKLERIDYQDGQLDEITLTGCTNLISLDIRGNKLTALTSIIGISNPDRVTWLTLNRNPVSSTAVNANNFDAFTKIEDKTDIGVAFA